MAARWPWGSPLISLDLFSPILEKGTMTVLLKARLSQNGPWVSETPLRDLTCLSLAFLLPPRELEISVVPGPAVKKESGPSQLLISMKGWNFNKWTIGMKKASTALDISSHILWLHPSKEDISGSTEDWGQVTHQGHTGIIMYLFLMRDFLEGMYLSLIHLVQNRDWKEPWQRENPRDMCSDLKLPQSKKNQNQNQNQTLPWTYFY